jgi:hypothetical protein
VSTWERANLGPRPVLSKATKPVVNLADALGDTDTMAIWADVEPGQRIGPDAEELDRAWVRMFPPDKSAVMRTAGVGLFRGVPPVEALNKARQFVESKACDSGNLYIYGMASWMDPEDLHKRTKADGAMLYRAVCAIYRAICALPEEWFLGDEPPPMEEMMTFAREKLRVEIQVAWEEAWLSLAAQWAVGLREHDRAFTDVDAEALLKSWEPNTPALSNDQQFKIMLRDIAEGRVSENEVSAAANAGGYVFTTPKPPKLV